ncbi:MAG: hypothetical protein A3G34_12650 [Candidatus Lindowbacteria bacterium RIFCSPLOWO2_12_FULL_62_27]|nr:MAG: hypothetical protein A3I06_15415 [Candidatus Lindowbacteria bacterium RIFCSPLOWO2_02_FULL_62_12]OGH62444.1 MAG: hypothetical protein A3G34_12650 [Candidatus Lindowbacteria bacterium RIFCSPLOWO2_12_FULL_62_27]
MAVFAATGLKARPEYGDACAEAMSVHRSVGVMVVPESTLSLAGEDRTAFLHNICSNDLKSLGRGQGCCALMLTPKGKILFPFAARVSASQVWVQAADRYHAAFKQFLESSLVMEDVAVRDTAAEFQVFHLAGMRSADIMADLSLPIPTGTELSWISAGPVTVVRRRRTLRPGVDLIVASADADAWFEKLQAATRRLGGGPVGTIAADILRIEAAIAAFGVDFSGEHFPQEAALEEQFVSFTKGCYTGQEVVARIKTYGGVNRRLVGLVLDGPPAAPGDRVFRNGAECGAVTSAARSLAFSKSVALAMVAKPAAVPGAVVRIGGPEGPGAVVVDIAVPRENPWEVPAHA